MRALPLILLLMAVAAGPARGADHPIEGDSLALSDRSDPSRRRARFRATRDPAIDPALAGDPSVLGATLEISGSGPGDGSSGVISLFPAFWTGLGNPAGSRGFRYLDRDAGTGVKKVLFKPGTSGGQLVVVGGGSNWPYAVSQAQSAVRVRFEVGADVYCAKFTSFRRNEAGRVVARNAAAPPSCAAAAVCGDGIAEGSEECDDANTADGDGCSAACQLEDASALCAGVPAAGGTALRAQRIASGLTSPVHIAAPPLDPNRLFVVEQRGRIRIIENGALLGQPFLAIENRVSCCGERGLLSIAFHPDFESNGRFFVNYTNTAGSTVIARYEVGADPDDADEGSERILLTIAQPFANHNGGQLAFGPDGFLYAGMGDGGSAGDPQENGQNDSTLLGKMLRLDVNVEVPPYYQVPPGNPNAGAGNPLGLIWAKGLRNPWRFSFDRATGDLYIADVGQNAREEVDFQPAGSPGGENYGWDIFEGSQCFDPAPHLPACPDPPAGFAMPVHEYTHSDGCSITGGFVYRGCRLPDLRGTYFYSDFCTGFVRTFRVVGGAAQNHADRTNEVAPGAGLSIGSVSSFGEDARGELYLADYDGEVYQLVPGS